MLLKQHLTTFAAFISLSYAATSINDDQMTIWLNNSDVKLASAYAPMWFFGQAMNQPPCIPTWAYGGSPTAAETYDNAHRTPPAPQCQFPKVGCGCRNPDVAIGNPTPPFPIYYSYQKCNDNEVRVAYNLFYQKDGAKVGCVETGHDYDWEHVVVIHNKSNNLWTPSQLLLFQHSSCARKPWPTIQNTLTTREIQSVGDVLLPDGAQNNDHPKVYVAWSKHANYDTRNTRWNDPISQSTGFAFRGQDWWYFVDERYYVRADGGTSAGRAMRATDWGCADSIPPVVDDRLCSA